MEYVIILYVYPFRNFKLPESASFKLASVCVGGCPVPVFFLVTTHTEIHFSLYSVFLTSNLFIELFFFSKAFSVLLLLSPPSSLYTLSHRLVVIVLASIFFLSLPWFHSPWSVVVVEVDNRKLTHDSVIVLLPSLPLSLAASRHETPGARVALTPRSLPPLCVRGERQYAACTRDLPPAPLWSAHIESQPSSLLLFLFFSSPPLVLYLPTVIQWEEKRGDETTHPEMLLDPVTLFRLIGASSTSSWDIDRWEGREVCRSCRGNVERRVVFHGDA